MVTGKMLLPLSQNITRLITTVALCVSNGVSFYFLTLALSALPIEIVFGTWSVLGIFLITYFENFIFKVAINWRVVLGLLNDCRRDDIAKYFCLT
jgi:multidrug transporter EmrE-like cation transporter